MSNKTNNDGWIDLMSGPGPHTVIYENGTAWSVTREKFDCSDDAHDWAFANLPYGTVRFKTGQYEVVPARNARRLVALFNNDRKSKGETQDE